MRDTELVVSDDVIGFYEREYYCFSNFSSFAVEWRDRVWMTSEHAYQAAKFDHEPKIQREIAEARSAHDAKRIANEHNHKVPAAFHERKVELMEAIVRNKLYQHPYIQKKLKETGTMHLVEDSPKDAFWGWGPMRDGDNELGKIWMRLRNELPQK